MFDLGKHLSAAEQWSKMLLKSGIFFWLGTVTVWFWHFEASERVKLWESLVAKTLTLNALQASLITLICFLVITGVASLVKMTELFVLRLLEGYHYPRFFNKMLMTWQNDQIDNIEQQLQTLYQKQHEPAGLSTEDTQQLLKFERALQDIPETATQRMPTRLGNLLRKMELYPQQRYGLNVFVCWPHLWLVMPDKTKEEISNARDRLNEAAQTWMWGILWMVFSFYFCAWWAVLASLLVVLSAYYLIILKAASTYGKLVEASFDLYRFSLYQALHFSLPTTPAEELKHGAEVTQYLLRGSDSQTLTFEK